MKKLDMYRCEKCNNLVEVILPGSGELICCEVPMTKVIPKNQEDAMLEKHVPIFIKESDKNIEIRVGEILHPMEKEHHIMFIEAMAKDKSYSELKYLKPGEQPKMLLNTNIKDLVAREFCNIHGLWEGQNNIK